MLEEAWPTLQLFVFEFSIMLHDDGCAYINILTVRLPVRVCVTQRILSTFTRTTSRSGLAALGPQQAAIVTYACTHD